MLFRSWLAVVAYLALGSAVTKLGFKAKEASGLAESRGGRRGPENVWGSALVAALLAALTPWAGPRAVVLLLGFAASLSAKLADTFGSEIGKRWGRHTVLITTLRSVPRGTEGAISLEGTAASGAGSALMAAVMLGQLIKGLGLSNVVWGTDAIWTGAPQWQIEALRRIEIPEAIQRKYGYAPLGAADGPVKNAIFGENNARIYNYKPEQRSELVNDQFAYNKAIYEKHGEGRTNLAYGYVNRSTS